MKKTPSYRHDLTKSNIMKSTKNLNYKTMIKLENGLKKYLDEHLK